MAIWILLLAGSMSTFVGVAGFFLIPAHISLKIHIMWAVHLLVFAVGLPISILAISHRRLAAQIIVSDLCLGYAVVISLLVIGWPQSAVNVTKFVLGEWPVLVLAIIIVIRAAFEDSSILVKMRP